jgi:hypothetical protein
MMLQRVSPPHLSSMPDGDVLTLFAAALRGLAYGDSALAEPAMVTISLMCPKHRRVWEAPGSQRRFSWTMGEA